VEPIKVPRFMKGSNFWISLIRVGGLEFACLLSGSVYNGPIDVFNYV